VLALLFFYMLPSPYRHPPCSSCADRGADRSVPRSSAFAPSGMDAVETVRCVGLLPLFSSGDVAPCRHACVVCACRCGPRDRSNRPVRSHGGVALVTAVLPCSRAVCRSVVDSTGVGWRVAERAVRRGPLGGVMDSDASLAAERMSHGGASVMWLPACVRAHHLVVVRGAWCVVRGAWWVVMCRVAGDVYGTHLLPAKPTQLHDGDQRGGVVQRAHRWARQR
jgi:hypothetical protein